MPYPVLTPEEIERKAADAGMTLHALCKAAEIAPSTFTRWRSGATKGPTLRVYCDLVAAVEAAEQRASA